MVSAERRIGVPNSSLVEMHLRVSLGLETPAHISADIARSLRWRINLTKVLPIAESKLVSPQGAIAISDPLGING